MGIDRKQIDEMLDELKQKAEELRVKLNLAKMEARDEWQNLEAKLVKLESRARELGSATVDASHDVAAAAVLLGEEIRDGFKKIARHF